MSANTPLTQAELQRDAEAALWRSLVEAYRTKNQVAIADAIAAAEHQAGLREPLTPGF